MIKEAIGVAADIAQAQLMAIKKLAAPIEADVKIEVIEMPKKKLFGLFGGSDAKVKAWYDDGKAEPVKASAPAAAPAKEKPVQKAAAAEAAKPAAKKESAKPAEKKPGKAPAKENKPAPKKEAVKPEVNEPDLSGIEAKETPATDYLKAVLTGMGIQGAGVTVKEAGNDLYFEITCDDDFGNIIGRRGETLDALQYLTRLFVNRSSEDGKRVSLNVGDYRKRREETLTALAQRQAARALKIGRNSVLDPMNPYERRIVHTAIQGIEGVSSHSVGEGDNRRVVIVPDNASSNGRGYQRGGRGGQRREKRAPYVPEAPKEPREQKIDAPSVSRYGKIEPKKPAAPAED